ncbi:MAG: helix-turn-helix domain-containing protein [Lachnospiraceae bacterium]|nr:helix-turn-helix domain-containing protein [Lachnospiraceae bacterium]
MRKSYLTTSDVANELGISSSAVADYCQKGYISPVRIEIGGRRLYSLEAVKALKEKIGANNESMELITADKVAKILMVSIATVYAYEDKGYIKPVKVLPSGRRFFSKAEIEAMCPSESTEDLITTSDLAKLAGVSVSFVYTLKDAGIIQPARKILTSRALYRQEDVATVKSYKGKKIDKEAKNNEE